MWHHSRMEIIQDVPTLVPAEFEWFFQLIPSNYGVSSGVGSGSQRKPSKLNVFTFKTIHLLLRLLLFCLHTNLAWDPTSCRLDADKHPCCIFSLFLSCFPQNNQGNGSATSCKLMTEAALSEDPVRYQKRSVLWWSFILGELSPPEPRQPRI